MLSSIHFLTSRYISACVKVYQVFPPLLHTVSKQQLELKQHGTEASVMKQWENYVAYKVWQLIWVKLYSQLNNYQKFMLGRGALESTSEIVECFLGQGGVVSPLNLWNPVKPFTWTFSTLGLQLAVDKFFIYYLVINLTSLSASSIAFAISAGPHWGKSLAVNIHTARYSLYVVLCTQYQMTTLYIHYIHYWLPVLCVYTITDLVGVVKEDLCI